MDWAKHFRASSSRSDALSIQFGAEPQSVIQAAQQKLNNLGYGPISVDGIAGPQTAAATMRFQSDNGLTADGVIGPQTLGAMGLDSSGETPTKPSILSRIPNPFSGLKPSSAKSDIPGIKQSVLDAMPSLFGHLEGQALPYMYTDSKGFVTTGTGNLIDPVSSALALPWKNSDGSPASQSDIETAWQTVKDAWPGVQSVNSQSLTNIRLDAAGLEALFEQTVKRFKQYLDTEYPGWVNWPADAQLMLLSRSWSWGPAFASEMGTAGAAFNTVVNAKKPDFLSAIDYLKSVSGHEESINPGIVPRDDMEYQLLTNAATALQKGANFDKLYYPGSVVGGILSALSFLGLGVLAIGLGVVGYDNYSRTGKLLP
jgi:hypothetical protein